jgi:hypothetical protein
MTPEVANLTVTEFSAEGGSNVESLPDDVELMMPDEVLSHLVDALEYIATRRREAEMASGDLKLG